MEASKFHKTMYKYSLRNIPDGFDYYKYILDISIGY